MYEKEYKNTQPIAVPDGGSSGRRLTVAGLFALVAIIAMLVRGDSVETIITWGASLFGIAYALEAIGHSPLLIAWTVCNIEERTKREEINLRFEIEREQPRRLSVEPLRALPEPRQDELPDPPDNFVPSVSPSDYNEAVAYVRQLYRNDLPDDNKVVTEPKNPIQKGRFRHKIPSEGALEWLKDIGIVREIKIRGRLNGYALDTDRCPTLADARQIIREHTPRPPYPSQEWGGGVGREYDER